MRGVGSFIFLTPDPLFYNADRFHGFGRLYTPSGPGARGHDSGAYSPSMVSMHYNEVHGHRSVQLARIARSEIRLGTAGADPQDFACGGAESGRPRLAETKRRDDWRRRRAAPSSRSGDEMRGDHRGRQPSPGGNRARDDPRAYQTAPWAVTH